MKILIQPSGLRCQNVGDHAMLETAYGRLRAMWPDAEIRVITLAPDVIRKTLPGAIPLSPEGRNECFDLRLFGRLSKPGYPFWRGFRRLEEVAFQRAPWLQAFAAQVKMNARGCKAAAGIIAAIKPTDLYVFSGAGMVTDAFAGEAIDSLELLHLAGRFGARTAILGHMFGPVTNRELKAVCRAVLPNVDLISVRERVTSLPFLAECGVRTEDVLITGDETLGFIEDHRLAVQDRNALGVNVRIAYYSGLGPSLATSLREVLRTLSRQFGAPVQPLAVAHYHEDDDALALRFIDSGLNIGLKATEPEGALTFVKHTGRCRLVITGSYHAAVFALAQGVPAVGLAFAPYYEAKFKGLQDLFGNGCRYVDGTKQGWEQQLHETATELWGNAPSWRDQLLDATWRQVGKTRAAYEELYAIVRHKMRRTLAGVKAVSSQATPEGA